ncbi:DUF4082 domain-containing protein [Terrimonas sp. NA20]|uniref:DUF4082 domain-containing protein n=1 Tax=Terrimonas ginsenosidimutans TaxID=2908004 RepID=A0ABS9KKJ1_9BACT|nr:DUF4082 domain-containing protein [Terrimonas ginsenosidimutans]MCG2612853.1 DUF4082 domain-containing protein [Terrimonas ginsenosidimutans]
MKKILLIAIILTPLMWSCKKDQVEINKQEPLGQKVLENLLEHTEIVDTVLLANVNALELGMRFYSINAGKITHLGCKMPYAGKFTVSLWDHGSKQLLASEMIDNYPDRFSYADIVDIPAMANQRFVISVNNVTEGVKRPYYISQRKSSTASLYPFTAGNIVYEAFHSKLTTVPLYPDAVTIGNQSFVAGYPDFIIK